MISYLSKVKVIMTFWVLFFLTSFCFSQEKSNSSFENNPFDFEKFTKIKNPYLGLKPAGMEPELFAPGIITTEYNEGSSGFNLEGDFFVFQRRKNNKVYTFETKIKNGRWSFPELVPFAGMMRNGDFTIAPDGKTLLFQAATHIKEIKTNIRISNLWETKKISSGWTKPEHLGFEVNTKWPESFASITKNGVLYFFSRRPGGFGKSDLHLAKLVNGEYKNVKNLGSKFNTEYDEWDPFIAPDESYLIFCSTKPGGYGGDDFYISFRNGDGIWTKPNNMGDKINCSGSDNRPYVTPDGKYFFYTSTKRGNRDIYWMDAKILLTYKN